MIAYATYMYMHVPRMRTFSIYDDPYHLAKEGCDGRTDKNHQTIAVTLCLRFATRINNVRASHSLSPLLLKIYTYYFDGPGYLQHLISQRRCGH